MTTLDPNQSCSIGFDGSASGIAQSLACTRKLGKHVKSKLFSYGIGGKTLKWINAFLCYRQQRVVVKK